MRWPLWLRRRTAHLVGDPCPGSGQRPMWAKTHTGDCPHCYRTCNLVPNPDGGPGSVLVEHRRSA